MQQTFNEILEKLVESQELSGKLDVLSHYNDLEFFNHCLAIQSIDDELMLVIKKFYFEKLIKEFRSSKATGMLDILSKLTQEEIFSLIMEENNELASSALVELNDLEKLEKVILTSKWQNVRRFAINMINDFEKLVEIKLNLLSLRDKDSTVLIKLIEDKQEELKNYLSDNLEEISSNEVSENDMSNEETKHYEKKFEAIEKILDSLENQIETSVLENEVTADKIDNEFLGKLNELVSKLELISAIDDQNKKDYISELEQNLYNIQNKLDVKIMSVEDVHATELAIKNIRQILNFINWQLSIRNKFEHVLNLLKEEELSQYGINILIDLENDSATIINDFREYRAYNLDKFLFLDFKALEVMFEQKQSILKTVLSIKKENLKKHIEERLADLQDKVEKGQFNQLDKKLTNVELRIKVLDKDEATKYSLKVKELRTEYFNRKNLYTSTVYPKQEELCRQLEELLENKDINNIEIMKILSQVSKEWQILSKGVDKQIHWYRFDQARKNLMERGQIHISQFSDIRKENSKKREMLERSLEEYVSQLKDDNVVINDLLNKKATIWKEWTMARPFNAEQNNTIRDSFKKNMDILDGYLKDFYKSNYSKKIDFINEAKRLLSLDNRRDAIKQCIKIQFDWKNVGNSGIHEVKLWKEFKSICDEIFKSSKSAPTNQSYNKSSANMPKNNLLQDFFDGVEHAYKADRNFDALLNKFPEKSDLLYKLSQPVNMDRNDFMEDLAEVQIVLGFNSNEEMEVIRRVVKLKLLSASRGVDKNYSAEEKLLMVKEKIINLLRIIDSSVLGLQISLLDSLKDFIYKNNIKVF